MADYCVRDTNLTAIANAIRQRGETQAALEFPDDFVTAIRDIPAEGGVTLDQINAIGAAGVSGEIVLNGTSLRPFMFAGDTGITKITMPNIQSLGANPYGGSAVSYAFSGCTGLTEANMPNLTALTNGRYLFSNCANLETLNLNQKNWTALDQYVFHNCTKFPAALVMPKLVNLIPSNFLANCAGLEKLDFCITSRSAVYRTIQANAFSGCSSLNVVIIRSSDIVALANVSAFTGTPFASGGSGGTLYVPNALKVDYEASAQWSTILGYPNNSIAAIEGSIYESNYADGTPVE